MTRAVLSIGSNLGDRLARLQSAICGLGSSVRKVSGVYETEAWGGVDQGRFLNAVVIVDDPGCSALDWLHRAHRLEDDAQRVRGQRWGPRTLDVDVISCLRPAEPGEPPGEVEVLSHQNGLMLPHPLAHLRAFVVVPWLEVEPQGELTVMGRRRPVTELLSKLDRADRAGIRLTDLVLHPADRWK